MGEVKKGILKTALGEVGNWLGESTGIPGAKTVGKILGEATGTFVAENPEKAKKIWNDYVDAPNIRDPGSWHR